VSLTLYLGVITKGVIMSSLDDRIPTGIHIVEMVNGDCICSREKQAEIITSALGKMTKFDTMITYLRHLKATSPIGAEIELASDLLEVFDKELVPSKS
jgi:hypothetical protein